MKTYLCLAGGVLLIWALSPDPLTAQEANNPWSHSYQAVHFGDQQNVHDPVTLVMPGTAFNSGFSSYLENPASAALFDRSFGSFGLSFRNISEDTQFMGMSSDMSDNQAGVSNLGFVYRFPTERGSLVWGAGYSQHSSHNRALSISGRNEETSITDHLKIPGSEYSDVAFNAYAIDYGDEFEDWDESILRVGFSDFGTYLGMDQEAEFTQRGGAGEYSTFLATEFLENLMLGASFGIQSGRHTYKRTFLEIDRPNNYTGTVIDSNDDGNPDTDIDRILLTDELRSEYVSLTLRTGMLYKLTDHLNIAASYTFPSRLSVDEELDGRIISTFNNGIEFDDDLRTSFSWTVRSPARVNLGAALTEWNGISLSVSAEYVDYSNTRIDFDSDLFEEERNENRFIGENYRAVWNLRGSLAYSINDQVTLRGGYGLRPSRFSQGGVDTQLLSAGIGFDVSRQARIQLGAQYAFWRDEPSVVYDYADYDYTTLPDSPPPSTIESATAFRDGNRLQLMGTLQLFFN
jgi:hypothetical protein